MSGLNSTDPRPVLRAAGAGVGSADSECDAASQEDPPDRDFSAIETAKDRVDIDTWTTELHKQLRTPVPRAVPYRFTTQLIAGVRSILNSGNAMKEFVEYIGQRDSDVVVLQGVCLRSNPDKGRSVPCAQDKDVYDEFCAQFPDYAFSASLSTTAVGGQMVGVRKSCEVPAVSFNLCVPTPENKDTHDPHGAIITLEFPSCLLLCRIAADTGPNIHERILKRNADDKAVTHFLKNQATINDKMIVYMGYLDVCNNANDMTSTASQWQEYVDPKRKDAQMPDSVDNHGWSSITNTNRKSYRNTLSEAGLVDAGAIEDDYWSCHTEKGIGGQPNQTGRSTSVNISKILFEADCVIECNTPGKANQRVGHFGQMHSPVTLVLRKDWNHRVKGVRCKVLSEVTPHFKRKLAARKARQQPQRAADRARMESRSHAFLDFLKLTTTLSVLNSTPSMPTGAQYFTTHRDGEIIMTGVNGEPVEPIKFHSLWDTGASNSNYMSSQFYDRHKDLFDSHSVEVDTSVTLGDKKTKVKLNKMVTLYVRFTGDKGEVHEAEIPFMVLDSQGRDIIIGMPSLIADFGHLFKHMVDKAVGKYSRKTVPTVHYVEPPESTLMLLDHVFFAGFHHENNDFVPPELKTEVDNLPEDGFESAIDGLPPEKSINAVDKSPYPGLSPPEGCEYPWANPFCEVCPEDEMIPEAMSNPEHLVHLTQSYDDELAKFYSLIEEHIDSEFIALRPRVVDLLKKYVDCFVKKEWIGLDLPEIIIRFKDTLPERLKPYSPRIPQNLMEHSEKEIRRMLTYFYEECESPWASPLTVAPKATDPYIRLCVNLRKINTYVDFGHFPIPNVKGTLDKLLPYRYFCDIDLKSSFHQMKLSYESSMKLSVATPWGQFRPKYVPEGLCQASQNLQESMNTMFGGLGDWCSVLFDNILIGGETELEMVENLEKLMAKAEEYNVYLKIEKTWIGFQEVKFFGYKVTNGRYYLEDSRSEAIDLIPFPNSKSVANNTTAMRSFLGQTRIFQPHVPDYTSFAAPLEQMTSVNFNWDKATWTEDFPAIFDEFKARLKTAMILFMPDFSKEWIMRTDASETGYGGVLYQVSITEDGKRMYEPLTFISRKWSDPATRWDTFTQECFGIFACVKECSHLLQGKPFIIETDHANLRTMEASLVPKIIRQHLYLRNFTCWVRHVPGKSNTADYWSRLLKNPEKTLESLYLTRGDEEPPLRDADTETELLCHLFEADDQDYDFWNDSDWLEHRLCAISCGKTDAEWCSDEEEPTYTAQDLFDSVHGGKNLHQGVRRTWLLLNKIYPAHLIPIAMVQSMVDECAMCQKFRLSHRDKLTPLTRVLKPPHHRCTIGVDTVTITPESDSGYKAIITVVNHYTHFVFLYPVKRYDSESLANALMAFISNFGLFDELISDPGSDLTSKAIQEVNEWLGVRHVVSLVDVHTSNGCENTNKHIITHLSALCNDLRIKDKWSDPKIIALIQLHFNGQISAEAGITPFEAMFGNADDTYYDLGPNIKPENYQTEYVTRLDKALQQLRIISAEFQDKLCLKRLHSKPTPHQFVVGDMVLKSVRTPTKHCKPEKLGPAFYGPYVIERVHQNDYTCRHITDGTVHEFPVDALKPYFGTRTMAKRAALLDHDQYFVTRVSHYVGDPSARTSMEFYLNYSDGDEQWKLFDRGLIHCEAFILYCESVPELWPLLTTDTDYRKLRVALNKLPISEITPGDIRYVDLRSIDPHWYNGLLAYANPEIPAENVTTYVVPYHIGEWTNPRSKTKIKVTCPLLDHTEDWNHDKVKSWGTYTQVLPHQHLVDEQFLFEHPSILRSLLKWKLPSKPLKKSKVVGRPSRRAPTVPAPKPVIRSAPSVNHGEPPGHTTSSRTSARLKTRV
jgi:exonuclease III